MTGTAFTLTPFFYCIKALIQALQDGWIAGAGLDVTTQEPIEADNPLLGMDNVIITPHALCWTDECFHDIAATALTSILEVAQGRIPAHVVNRNVLTSDPLTSR